MPPKIHVIAIVVVALTVACSAGTSAPSNSLTVRGAVATSQSSPLHIAFGQDQNRPGTQTGDPSSIGVGMYALYISQNRDCSSPVLVEDYGATALVKDFEQSPTLFTGSPAMGSYACVAVKMSDVIAFKAKTTFGSCDSTQTYQASIYTTDNTNLADSSAFWRDINLQPVAPVGTHAAPVVQPVLLLFTQDTTAALQRGFNRGQTLALGSPLVVPGSQTFIWAGSGTVLSDSITATCNLNPGKPSFQ